MASIPGRSPGGRLPLPVSPWTLLLSGFGLIGVGLLAALLPGDAFLVVRILFLLAGLIAAGGAVWLKLGAMPLALQDCAGHRRLYGAIRRRSPARQLRHEVRLGLCRVGALRADDDRRRRSVAHPALADDAKIAVSLLVLFHFGGIFVATTAVPPRGEAIPWWTAQLWAQCITITCTSPTW